MSELSAFFEAAVRTATPLGFAALGEVVVERSGVINIGLEGSIIAGAFAGLVAAGIGGVWFGFGGAMVAGVLVALIFAMFVIGLRTNQIITGTAISLLGLGTTAALNQQVYGATGAGLSIPTMQAMALHPLADIPFLGGTLFNQPSITYVLYVLVPCVWWWMYRTRSGLATRATGEDPRAAIAAGVHAARSQFWSVIFGGALGGIAGGVLVIAQAGSFAEGMSAGRGFIAIAIVVLGRWHPIGVGVAALVFGAASALQYFFQAIGWTLPYQLFLAMPYIITLVGLAGVTGRSASPASLGYWPEQR